MHLTNMIEIRRDVHQSAPRDWNPGSASSADLATDDRDCIIVINLLFGNLVFLLQLLI